ncbi:hypothetical protein M3Y94_00072100 [Aphelenchoides besseyi]|nr:hypothetical protein M3Y94_00072100 [Aphelenchoides besseyi]KAI6237863.1 hypothetical protein M3Y95_00309400 [Aphelenchoides besseyi]
MGNNGSFAKTGGNDENSLLRRNVRRHGFPLFREDSDGRSIRSRSLEPRATEACARVVEHSKSARYKRKKSPNPTGFLDLNDPRLLAWSRQAEQRTDTSRSPSPNAERSCFSGLTRHHKMIMQKIWMRADETDKSECAKSILSHLLRSNNQFYQIFNLNGMTDKEIVNSSRFARLSQNFSTVFDFVITNFDDLKKVAFALECLGAHHANFGFAIPQSYWSTFTRVFEDNPPKIVFQNPEGHVVWKLLVNFIVRTMHNGYARELENGQRKTSNTLHVDRAF